MRGGTTNEKKVTSVAYKENHTDTLGYTTIGLKKGDKVVVSFDYEAKDIVFESNSKISAQFNEYYAYSGFGLVLRGNGKGHHTSSIITLNTHYNSSDPVVETDNGSPFIRFDYIKINPGGYFRVWNFMVNKGTVEADWTLAIEDVNGMIEDAQKAADDAAEAAKNAQADATNANKELANIKSDNLISPIEKTALKQQQADIRSEYGEITANAARYAVSTTAYKSAYDLANAALTKYTASSPEYITVGSDYANISAYYDARKTILDAIAAGAKKAADDATNKANQAVEDAARAGHYYLDLDNDGGPVSCDASGNVTGGFPSSKATVYYGTEPDTGWAFTGAFSGCSGSVNSSTGQITVTGVSADTGTVTVTAKKSGKTRPICGILCI